MINPPCKDCRDREIGCHCSCGKYKGFQEQQAVNRAAAEAEYKKALMFKDVERPQRRIWDNSKRQRNDITRNRTK